MSAPTAPDRLDVDAGDGLVLHVERAGGGAPLLLLHGFTGSGESWAPLLPALAACRTTLAADLPGHGRSSAPDDPARHALPRVADDLARVLDAAGAGRAAALGYSLGGRAALHLAVRHPRRVAALVLVSASAGVHDPAERAARRAADAALADAIERDGVPAFVDRWEQLPLWASQAALPAAVRARLRTQRLANSAPGLAGSLRAAGPAADPVPRDRLAALALPTLVVAGALDAKYVALGGELAAAIPGARLAVVPDAGHAVHLEQPAALAALVTEFLRDVDRAAG